jgi:multiple sugar transport system permease protein
MKLLKLACLAAFAFWSLAPIVLVIASSFKPARLIFEVPPQWLFEPTLESYRLLISQWPDFFRCLGNSLVIAVGSLSASAFFMVFIRMFPPIVITLPLFPVANRLGLMDTHFLLILLYATFFVSLSTWIVKTGVDQIPYELEEAARVDGASLAQVLRLVIAPLIAPTLVAAGIFVFIFAWNEFLFAFVFTTTKAKTAPLILSEMLGSATGVDWGAVFAAATLQLAPVLACVMLAQKYVVAGLTAGSVKS